MAHKKHNRGFFGTVGMFVVVGAMVFGFAYYKGWIHTNANLTFNTDKASADTKAFIKTLAPDNK